MKKSILFGTSFLIVLGIIKLTRMVICSIENDIKDISNINFNDLEL